MGFLHAFGTPVQDTEVVPGCHQIRLELHRGLVADPCLIPSAAGHQDIAQIGPCMLISRRFQQRLLHQLQGFRWPLPLEVEHAQVMQRVRLIGVGLQHPAIDAFCKVQVATLVAQHGLLQAVRGRPGHSTSIRMPIPIGHFRWISSSQWFGWHIAVFQVRRWRILVHHTKRSSAEALGRPVVFVLVDVVWIQCGLIRKVVQQCIEHVQPHGFQALAGHVTRDFNSQRRAQKLRKGFQAARCSHQSKWTQRFGECLASRCCGRCCEKTVFIHRGAKRGIGNRGRFHILPAGLPSQSLDSIFAFGNFDFATSRNASSLGSFSRTFVKASPKGIRSRWRTSLRRASMAVSRPASCRSSPGPASNAMMR